MLLASGGGGPGAAKSYNSQGRTTTKNRAAPNASHAEIEKSC